MGLSKYFKTGSNAFPTCALRIVELLPGVGINRPEVESGLKHHTNNQTLSYVFFRENLNSAGENKKSVRVTEFGASLLIITDISPFTKRAFSWIS